MSPLYGEATMAEFISFYKLPAILVCANYLGSINHTLLTIEVMKSRNIPIVALVMCGQGNKEFRGVYRKHMAVCRITARIPFLEELNSDAVKECAANIKDKLSEHLQHEHA